jgi:hypothetical protein
MFSDLLLYRILQSSSLGNLSGFAEVVRGSLLAYDASITKLGC